MYAAPTTSSAETHAIARSGGSRSRRLALAAVVSLTIGSAVGSAGFGSGPAFAATGDSQVIKSVVAAVSPAVVTIVVTTGGTGSDGQAFGGMPQLQGSGSGVLIDPDGLILTNRHVAGDATSLTVTLSDGRVFPGRTIGVDTLTDFAFVKIEAADLPSAPLGDSSSLEVGQLAIAIGNPLGELPGTVTSGIISGLDRTITVGDPIGQSATTLHHLIQTDASINPGNSGGPLLDGDGQVIGIDTAEAGSATGIGFALPIDLAKPIIAQVLAGEPIERPWIGIQYQSLDAQLAADGSLPVSDGAWVHADATSGQPAVVAGSPARSAGLKDGDIITALDGQAIDRQHQLDLLLLQHAPGEKVVLSILRDGHTKSIDLKLGTRPAGT